MKNENVWIIAVCNSSGDGIDMETKSGTKQEIKKHLMKRIKDYDSDYGCEFEGMPENEDDILDTGDYLYAGPFSYDYHVDFVAQKLSALLDVSLRKEGARNV